jgi:hypothetical protein
VILGLGNVDLIMQEDADTPDFFLDDTPSLAQMRFAVGELMTPFVDFNATYGEQKSSALGNIAT